MTNQRQRKLTNDCATTLYRVLLHKNVLHDSRNVARDIIRPNVLA